MSHYAQFEPAGTPSPIGHYKSFARYNSQHHFIPEDHGGTVFNDGGSRRWVYFQDATVNLNYSLSDMICLLEKAIAGDDINYIEENASCPDDWGLRANYIDMFPCSLGGLHGMIRLLPSIPASQRGTATCIILRGMYAWGGHDSYAVNWFGGIDGFDYSLFIDDPQQGHFEDHIMHMRAFNTLAHARGIKTGFSVIINDGQLNFNGKPFNWNNSWHKNFFIDQCVFAVTALGFDAIHFDSARHIGGYDYDGHYHLWEKEGYCGVGFPPPFVVMQEITHEIRRRSQRRDLSFIGEYANEHERFREMGLTAGIAHDVSLWDKDSLSQYSDNIGKRQDYRAGFFISNDNDDGTRPWESRLDATYKALLIPSKEQKLPVLFTQADLWPMLTGYHDLILNPKQWHDNNGLFHPQSAEYTWRMHEIWAEAARRQ